MSRLSSPALQTMMAGTQEDNGESCDTTQHDHYCPNAGGGKLNFRISSCHARLKSNDVPLSCRRCAYGKKVNSKDANNPTKKNLGLCCICGREWNGKYKSCDSCREDRKEYNRQKYNTPEKRKARNADKRMKYHVDKQQAAIELAELKEKCDE